MKDLKSHKYTKTMTDLKEILTDVQELGAKDLAQTLVHNELNSKITQGEGRGRNNNKNLSGFNSASHQ